ncbi:hypothetical protein L484_003563 [Morus notabilis]|uniref:Retrovirus-related Pol polyprotein from transposon TNT 1-94 n=1 Tax=Morus notabilis TaxID=981085 RepID=W9R2U2_9ROSA|nr:hypothetical protein L484_003563 [Morus notabilis]
MVGQIVGYQTAYEIWQALERSYAANSRSRLIELLTELQSLKNDGIYADEYVFKKKTIAYKLASIGDPISNADQLIYLFQGLGPKYNTFVIILEARPEQPSIEEVHSLLLTYDARLQRQNSSEQLSLPQAHLASLPTPKEQQHPNSFNFKPQNQKPNFT